MTGSGKSCVCIKVYAQFYHAGPENPIYMHTIAVIGIPKVLSTYNLDRVKIADYARNMTGKEIHLLGCWHSLREYRDNDLINIRSTDTCLPAVLAANGKSAWDLRFNDTIDLEHDSVDQASYEKVMGEFLQGCKL